MRELFDEAAEAGFSREAEKRRQTVGAMFRWAVSQDYLETDPSGGLKAYDGGAPRDRVLSDDEIRTLWHWLGSDTIPEAHVDAMKAQLALGARCGEVAGMMAGEVDTEAWTWTLPASRSKNGRERATPLVGIAREIIESGDCRRLDPCSRRTPELRLRRRMLGKRFTSAETACRSNTSPHMI